MSWTWDAPSGVYKNNALSAKIREAALPDFLFMRFFDPEPGYGKRKGGTINIQRVRQLAAASRVGETERLPSGRPVIDTKGVTVSEWGFKIEMTEFERNLSNFDLSNKFQKMLRNQISRTMDNMAAAALKTTPVIITPHATGGVDDTAISTTGAAGATANVNLGITHLRQIGDYLKGTLECPPFRNGRYVGLLSTKAARGIKNDPEYKDWLAPSTDEPFMKRMLKTVEDIDLYEFNNFDVFSNGVGTGSVLGEAVFFGEDAGFLATIMDPELRTGIPQDLGRFHEVGWVAEIEAGLTWDAAAEQRVLLVSSL